MAIKAGQLIHYANKILVDRAQTAGPGTVNINRTKIYELGNYQSVGSVTDLPDLTFTLESFDVSAELEATMTGKQFGVTAGTQTITVNGSPTGGTYALTFEGQATAGIAPNAAASTVETRLRALSTVPTGAVTVTGSAGGPYTATFSGTLTQDGSVTVLTADPALLTGGTSPTVTVDPTDTEMDDSDDTTTAAGYMSLSRCQPLDVASQFKGGTTAADPFAAVGAVAIPYLTLESMSYRFGLTDNASQTATLRGDGLYYAPSGSAYIQEAAGTNTGGQNIVLSHTVTPFNGDTVASTKYALSVSLSTGERLTFKSDYNETVTGGGTNKNVTVVITDPIPTTTTIRVTYLSNVADSFPQTLHATATKIRPAAIRGRNITVAVNGIAIADRWTSIQSVNIDWRVTLQRDEEFGNSQIIAQDYDVPDVTGSIGLKPRNYAELYKRIRVITGTVNGEVASALTTDPVSLYVELHSPDDGTVLKSFYVPDARFNLPGFQGRVQNKLEATFDWSSDSGDLRIYKGKKPGADA